MGEPFDQLDLQMKNSDTRLDIVKDFCLFDIKEQQPRSIIKTVAKDEWKNFLHETDKFTTWKSKFPKSWVKRSVFYFTEVIVSNVWS